MFFYIDESGNSGANLFDEDQPFLYYGVLSSPVDLDSKLKPRLEQLRKKLGVSRLHANELGNAGLVQVVDDILSMQEEFSLKFDLYAICKIDHAMVCFFDQVFDQGLNPAVTWSGYWTPLRYLLLIKLAHLFDEETLKMAWDARIELNCKKANSLLIDLCRIIRGRVGILPDARSRQLIADALMWAESNPDALHYNVYSKKDRLSITPNIIGFQSVISGISKRIQEVGLSEPSSIIVDRQTEFNKAQTTLSEFYAKVKDTKWPSGPGLPEIDFSNFPTIPITFMPSDESVGLEIVDIYLWIFKRFLESKDLAPDLLNIIFQQLEHSYYDEISLNAIEARWSKVFAEMPEPTKDQMEKGKKILQIHEEYRLEAAQKLKDNIISSLEQT